MYKIDVEVDSKFLRDNELINSIGTPGLLEELSKSSSFYYLEYDDVDLKPLERSNEFDIWIVTHGKLNLTYHRKEGRQHLTSLESGECFLNSRLITGDDNHWNMKAMTPCYLLQIVFTQEILEKYPNCALLFNTVINKFAFPDENIRTHHEIKRIAIIPIQPGQLHHFENFLADFIPFFDSIGKTLILNSTNLRQILGVDEETKIDFENKKNILKLIKASREYEFIIYLLTDQSVEWINFCLASADTVVFTAFKNEAAVLSEFAHSCKKIIAKRYEHLETALALLRNDTLNDPESAPKWISPLKTDKHYNVNIASKRDLGRLVRLIINRPIALVLGSGASRGITQLGIYRAMLEADIPIDVVAGCSIGSLMGGLIAQQFSWQKCSDIVTRYLETINATSLTLPILSLINHEGAFNLAKMSCGEKDIEDLPLNFLVVAVSILNTDLIVFDRGNAYKGIAASSALPGIFPPVEIDGDILVDGAIMEPLPVVQVIENYDPGFIIAIDVTTEVMIVEEPVAKSVEDEVTSLLNSLKESLFGVQEKTVSYNLMDVILRLIEVYSCRSRRHIVRNNLADVYIRPNLDGIALVLNPEDTPKVIENSYHEFKEFTKQWRIDISKKVPLFDDLIKD